MRTAASLAVMIIAASAVTVACGQQRANSSGAGTGGAGTGGSMGVAAPGGCHPAGSAGAGRTVTVTSSDNGRSLCVRRGTGVMVVLRGSPGRRWTAIHASSSALVPRPNGRMTLEMGVTGAYFVAAHRGTAVLTSARPTCAATPGTVHCAAELTFRATVTVAR